MYAHFGLVLMVNHACNLRCSYCYTGTKFARSMPKEIAFASVDRALNSLHPDGTLELSFFGGEPLLESALMEESAAYARLQSAKSGRRVSLSFTTNGTIDTPDAWRMMLDSDVDLTISFDGLPEFHDRHRVDTEGFGSSARVLATISKLVAKGKQFQVITVVRPDTVAQLPAGLRFLREFGVDLVVPSLDLWTTWTDKDLIQLEQALIDSASVWRAGLPKFGVSWFNEKAIELSGTPLIENARCGFGEGEVAVSPAGHLYPCERLIGVDEVDNPARLNGHALDGADFLFGPRCGALASAPTCGLSCSCSNFVRSGRTDTRDVLLKRLDDVCLRETRRVLAAGDAVPQNA